MSPLLKRSPYNLRPRTARVTAYQAYSRGEHSFTVLQGDLDTGVLAARAQERHEQYLAGEAVEDDDPEVVESVEDSWEPPITQANSAPLEAQGGERVLGSTTAATIGRVGRTKGYSKEKKRAQRLLKGEDGRYCPYVNRQTKAAAKQKKKQAEAVHTEFAWSDSVQGRANRVAKSAFVGVRLRNADHPREAVTKAEALEMGLDEIEWDGEQDLIIVDAEGRVVVYLARKSANMDPMITRVERQFQIASEGYTFKPSQQVHRRGKFKAAASALSFGGGQQRVGNLKDSAHNRAVIEQHLLQNPDVINLAGYIDSAFQNAARDLHAEYGSILTSICNRDPNLRRNFTNSVFAGVTFNFGPQACTVPHTDHLNIPTGWCAVVALGNFNPDEGGHMILWDLNLLIRFPRGAAIFLPSALLVHSNTAIPHGQRRHSFTQYTAGGLARWVECGFKSQKEFLAKGGKFERTPQHRWEDGLRMFPTVSQWRNE